MNSKVLFVSLAEAVFFVKSRISAVDADCILELKSRLNSLQQKAKEYCHCKNYVREMLEKHTELQKDLDRLVGENK